MQGEYAPAPRRRPGEAMMTVVELVAAWDTETQIQLGATFLASMLLARSRMPALLAVFAAAGFGYLAKSGYRVAHDMHQTTLAIGRAAQLLADDYERAQAADADRPV